MNIKDLTFNQKIELLKTLNETYVTYGFGESLSDKAKKLSHSVLDSFEDESKRQTSDEVFDCFRYGFHPLMLDIKRQCQNKEKRELLEKFCKEVYETQDTVRDYLPKFIKKENL